MLMVAGAAAALAGCASLITGGDLIRPGEPTGTLEVRNVSQTDRLDVVLISDCDASTYGLNRLPSGTSIPPGGSYSFTLSAGCWDVGGGQILSQNSWTEGYVKVTVSPGRTTVIQSR
jgi:hypothetical protein